MSRSRGVESKKSCQNCNNSTIEIWFDGNHGEEIFLERHCKQCGWCIDPEGQIVNEGDIKLQNLDLHKPGLSEGRA